MNILRKAALAAVDHHIEVNNRPKKKSTKKKNVKLAKTNNPFKMNTSSKMKTNIIMIIFGAIAIFYSCAKGNYGFVNIQDETMSNLAKFTTGISEGGMFDLDFGGAYPKQVLFSLLAYGMIIFYSYMHWYENRHYADYEQHGTAKFMTPALTKKYNMLYNYPLGKPFAESDHENGEVNQIYSQNCQLALNTKVTGLNLNAMVIGGPGTGKSLTLVIPNILAAYGSYVVTDPSGELLKKTGKYLEKKGYVIKVLNLIDMVHSNTYNPFSYLRKEQDVLTMITSFINSTEDGVQKNGDPFWEKAEIALLEALVFYVTRYQKKKYQNFATLANMLRHAKQDPKQTETQLDKLFNEIRQYDSEDICVKQYDIFKQASDKTAQSILITTLVRLSMFNITAVKNLTSSDQMELGLMGDRKTALFMIVPSGGNAYKALVNMLCTQLFETLYYHAQTDCNDGALDYHVRLILDEFTNSATRSAHKMAGMANKCAA